MASLPENWESDYDGDRWFFRFKPTGLVQYTFPKPGDEYPEYVDVFSPPPELSPEEKLESHYQVKRRNTAGGNSKTSNTGKRSDGLTSATMAGPVDDTSQFWYQPDGLMYMGPGVYTDISPEEDEDEREGFRSQGDKHPSEVEPSPPVESPGQPERSYISPLTSAKTTPLASSSQPATMTPPTNVVATVHAATAVEVNTETAESPEVPYLDGRPIQSPVGYMPELASELTGQCREETHPAPVELPSHDMSTDAVAQPVVYANAFEVAPAELPARERPATRHVVDQKVRIPLVQGHSHVQQPSSLATSTAAQEQPHRAYRPPVVQNQTPLPPSKPPQSVTAAAQPMITKYQPYNPGRYIPAEDGFKRHSVIGISNYYPGAGHKDTENVGSDRRYSLAKPVPPRSLLDDVPAVLQPPQVPPKRPLDHDGNMGYRIAEHTLQHNSVSDRPHGAPVSTSLDQAVRVVPTILQPGGGQAGVTRPPIRTHQAWSAPNYQPYNPYPGGLEKHIEDTAQLYSKLPYGPEPPETVVPETELGSSRQSSSDRKPAINRANTLPLDMPALPYIGVDTSSNPPRFQAAVELPHQPTDSLSPSNQQGKTAVIDDYSSPTIQSPDFTDVLRRPLSVQPQQASNLSLYPSVQGRDPSHQYTASVADAKTYIQSLGPVTRGPRPSTTVPDRVSPPHVSVVKSTVVPPPRAQNFNNGTLPQHDTTLFSRQFGPKLSGNIEPTTEYSRIPGQPYVAPSPQPPVEMGSNTTNPRPTSMQVASHSGPTDKIQQRIDPYQSQQFTQIQTDQSYQKSPMSQEQNIKPRTLQQGQGSRSKMPEAVYDRPPTQREMQTVVSSTSTPPSQIVKSQSSADQRGLGPIPHVVSTTLQSQATSQGPHLQALPANRTENLPTQQQVPLPVPTKPQQVPTERAHPASGPQSNPQPVLSPHHEPLSSEKNPITQPQPIITMQTSLPIQSVHTRDSQAPADTLRPRAFPPESAQHPQSEFVVQPLPGPVPMNQTQPTSPSMYSHPKSRPGKENTASSGRVFRSGSIENQNPVVVGIVSANNDGNSNPPSVNNTPGTAPWNKQQRVQPMTTQTVVARGWSTPNTQPEPASRASDPRIPAQATSPLQNNGQRTFVQTIAETPNQTNPPSGPPASRPSYATQHVGASQEQKRNSFASRASIGNPNQRADDKTVTPGSKRATGAVEAVPLVTGVDRGGRPLEEAKTTSRSSMGHVPGPIIDEVKPAGAAPSRHDLPTGSVSSFTAQKGHPRPESVARQGDRRDGKIEAVVGGLSNVTAEGKSQLIQGGCLPRDDKSIGKGVGSSGVGNVVAVANTVPIKDPEPAAVVVGRGTAKSAVSSPVSAPLASVSKPAPVSSDAKKWDTSGYDGSGWGDDDDDEYDYGNGYGGYGGGYR